MFIISCKHEPQTALDSLLIDKIKNESFTYYQGDNSVLSPRGDSPHGLFSVKFNSIAQSDLGNDGRLPQDSTFTQGAFIVKEVFNSNGKLDIYAIMYKDSSLAESNQAWIWAEYSKKFKTEISSSEAGASCVSCHSGSTNRDLVRLFDLH